METQTEHSKRVTITIEPDPSEDGLLKVEDALKQVLDCLLVARDAQVSAGYPNEVFDWRLESASTNTPLTVVAVAEARDPSVDITGVVEEVKRATAQAFRSGVEGGSLPEWISQEGLAAFWSIFERHRNGVSHTTWDFGGDLGKVSVDAETARSVYREYEETQIVPPSLPRRTAYGELEGRLIHVGLHYGYPAIRILHSMYGKVWCVVEPRLIDKLGGSQTLADVWHGKTVVVGGRLDYSEGGDLARITVDTFREKKVPHLDLTSILDPDFTAGLDPVEYLSKLHEGDLG